MRACFTGYRPGKLPWREDESLPACRDLKRRLEECIRRLIAEGCSEFVSGCAEGVDTYCAELVLKIRAGGAAIALECAVPCPGQQNAWSPEARRRYEDILAAADKVVVLSPRYTRGCMHRRNEYMVDTCDAIVGVFDGKSGGTAATLRYAAKRGKRIILLGVTE